MVQVVPNHHNSLHLYRDKNTMLASPDIAVWPRGSAAPHKDKPCHAGPGQVKTLYLQPLPYTEPENGCVRAFQGEGSEQPWWQSVTRHCRALSQSQSGTLSPVCSAEAALFFVLLKIKQRIFSILAQHPQPLHVNNASSEIVWGKSSMRGKIFPFPRAD